MYSVDSLTDAVTGLYRDSISDPGYTEDEVKDMLRGVDFDSLLQAVRHYARTVYAYTTQGKAPKSFNYRGAELFDQRATLLYEDFDQSTAAEALTSRTYELWLLEDMTFAVTACVTLSTGGGKYITEYREIKDGDPWDTSIFLDLEKLTGRLMDMSWLASENEIPVYEL